MHSILNPEPRTLNPLGYCISRDQYFKRDDVGIIYQMNVAPGGAQRHREPRQHVDQSDHHQREEHRMGRSLDQQELDQESHEDEGGEQMVDN